jgi:hypothetical protein
MSGRSWLRIVVIAAIFIVLLLVAVAFLVLLDYLAPGLGVQALVFLGAALSALLALVGVIVTQGVNVYTAWASALKKVQ